MSNPWAFDFTTRMREWRPLDRASYGGDRAKDIFLEPRVGVRFFERFVDGDELQNGEVVACDHPNLIVFTWYTADWEGQTELEVHFTAMAGGTRWTSSIVGSSASASSGETPQRSSAAAGRA